MKTCSIDGCAKPVFARGWCSAHYTKWKKYGDPLVVRQVQMHGVSVRERFLANFKQTSGCWEWAGYKDPNGYGRLNIDGKPVLAHRLSWAIFCHPIETQQQVLHRCDNPKCVRPEHLFLGDHTANMADKMAKKRHRYGVSRGEAHGRARLTAELVREIRDTAGPSRIVAEQYGISGRQVREIRARTAWRHIE